MRVIAGTAKSLKLKVQDGIDTRPTTDRIKETLFNMLQDKIADCVFIDLYSGSGSIGIEALSRGASKCYFVENNKEALNCIQNNLSFTRLEKKAIVIKQDVILAIMGIAEEKADIIFMDPPYRDGYEERVLEQLWKAPYVTEDTLILIESALDTDFSYALELGYEIEKEKRYKTNKHVFLRRGQKE